jgi:shikimate kinase / 3-dehydroquinate synthase
VGGQGLWAAGRGALNRVDLPAPPLPPGRPRLVVTGFMATGKTTVGRLAAEKLDIAFLDLDEVAAARAGRPVAGLIEEEGEERFRALERRLLVEAEAMSWTVVATGGGAVLHEEEFAALARDANVAVLIADPEDIQRRLGAASERPLLEPDPARRIATLLRERDEAYAHAGEALSTSGRNAEETATRLAERYRRLIARDELLIVDVDAPDHGQVVIGTGALERVARKISIALPTARTAALVADPGAARVSEEVADALAETGLRIVRVELPGGERAKTIDVLGDALTTMHRGDVEPTDVVVAVGGGAVLDVAGLAAATYARGVALVNVPTTLLAMVDAGLGGKVAIDHAAAKNLVGAFHPPRLVLADPAVLRTLPDRELRSGFAEIVKAAVLASPLLLDVLEREDVADRLEWVVEQAVRVKVGYVAADPRDRGLRRSLNLGHTFAHAIETASEYRVSHGEAVACGLIAAARLGAHHGVTDSGLEGRLHTILERFGLPTVAPERLDRARLLEAIAADKKRRSGRAAFIVPAPGGAALLEGIDPAEAMSFLKGSAA